MTLVIPRDAKSLLHLRPSRLSLSPLPPAEEETTFPIPHRHLHLHPNSSFPSGHLFSLLLLSFHAPCSFFPANSLSYSLPFLGLSLSLSPVWLVHRPPCIFPSCHPRPGLLQNIWTFCRQGFDIAFLPSLASALYTK